MIIWASSCGLAIAFVVVLLTATLMRRPLRCEGSPPKLAHTCGVSLRQIHPSPDADAETDVDIIAIHGLDTKSPDTWIWKSKSSDDNVNWLADKGMLPSRVGQARIFTCDWPSDLFERSDLTQKRIEELARLFLDGIQRRPAATNTYSGGDRPIVFIASCLGGIILMKALVMADHEYRSLRTATRAIVFLATPFGGTSFQDVARWAEPGLEAWASIRGQKVSPLLQSVKGSTFDLDELVRSFTQLCRDDHLDRVMTFYEMGKTNLYHKIFPCLSISSKQLVDESSATLQMVPHPLSLDRPHLTMNKFWGNEDPEYKMVAGKLEQFLQGIREGTVLKKADACIRDKHYTKERLKIERLSGEPLPMEQCYINLAIVEKPGENADRSEEGLRDADSAAQSSPFSVFARQKVETPDKTIQVNLATVFSQRKRRDGPEIPPKRILIRGRAGVGKTTLCKRMVYDFIHAGRWKELFDRVLWVPLRRLKIQPVEGWNLENLFYHEYFNQYPDSDRLAKQLWQELDGTKSRRTLFILDGLDEVDEAWNQDDYRSRFLMQLVNQPNVIITSRPSATLPPETDPIHLELETIGFYPDQVMAYIEKTFIDPKTSKTDQKTVDEIQSFLQKHWLIQGLVRIPIQLDALCYTWDELKHEDERDASSGMHKVIEPKPGNVPDTMTGMYKVIELKLWKKDVLHLGKKHGDKELTKGEIKTAGRHKIARFVKDETAFLESLAFTGLHNDVIDFTSEHMDDISDRFTPSLLPDKTMPSLSFLRTSDPSSEYRNRNYHFIHLTFQEYFAARYFVQQWKDPEGQLQVLAFGSKETKTSVPAEFLRKHKYTARYDVFWRFVVGLLDTTQQARFIGLIEKEPLDLLGPTHQRLVMHCLSELSNDLRIRKNLEARLLQWLLFEIDMTGSSLLAQESECPEECILTVLKTDSGSGRKGVLQALWHRGTHMSDTAIAALTALLQHEEWDVRSEAARALGRQSNLSDSTIKALTALLQDQVVSVGYAAAQALGGQSNLSDAAIAALTALLQDQEAGVRHYAALALGGQSDLSDEAIAALTALLQHQDSGVRYYAAEALGGQSNLSDTAIAALMALVQDQESDVRSGATQALGRQSNLPDEAVKALTALLQHQDSGVRYYAAQALGRQSNLSDTAIAALTALLQHQEAGVGHYAARALGRQSNLSDEAIKALTALLQHQDSGVRYYAAEALESQSNLSDTAIECLTALLQQQESDVRYAAAEALSRQSNLSDAAIAALTALVQDQESRVGYAAARALSRQSNLSDVAIASLTARLEHKEWDVRYAAAQALSRQSNLSDAAIAALTALLQHQEWAQYHAAQALGRQSNLSDAAIKALTALLQHQDSGVRYYAAEALGGQSNLSDTAIAALTALVQDQESRVRSGAARALSRQSNLSDTAIECLTALLQDKEGLVRSFAAEAVGGRSNLLDKVLEAIGFLLEAKQPATSMRNTFRNPEFLKSLYGALLRCSFREQLSSYVDGDSDSRSCIINQPSGFRTVSFDKSDSYDQFRTAVGDGQRLWNIHGYQLWDSLVM